MECNTASLLLYTLLVITEEFQVTLGYLINNSADACLEEYFYNGFQPVYMNTETESEILICQTLNEQKYFITRYSTQYKIPIYSAYRIDSFIKRSKFHGKWRSESSDVNSNPIKQAENSDYKYSGFNKGHLNPRCHNQNSVKNINATYTLTNAVPMTSTANTEWYRVAELPLFKEMKKRCRSSNSTRYIIVGVVLGKYSMKYSGINIPSYIWSAAYCDTVDNSDWSIGYLMDTYTTKHAIITIQDLQKQLKILSRSEVQLFNNTAVDNEEFNGINLVQRLKPTKRPRSHTLTCDIPSD